MERLERAVRSGPAAADVGLVDDVVVDECGSVEELERGRDGDDGGEGARGVGPVELGELTVAGDRRDGLPAPVAEQRTESLAARQKAARLSDEGGEIGRDLGESRLVTVECVVDPSSYQVD